MDDDTKYGSFKMFSYERSHRDTASAIEYTKLLIQIIIGINGFAVTALITLAGAMKSILLIKYIGIPCVIYIAGVVYGALAVFNYSSAQRSYAQNWYFAAENNDLEREKHRTRARAFQLRGERWIWWSIVLFALGSVTACGLLFIVGSITTS